MERERSTTLGLTEYVDLYEAGASERSAADCAVLAWVKIACNATPTTISNFVCTLHATLMLFGKPSAGAKILCGSLID